MSPAQVAAIRLGERPVAWTRGWQIGLDVAGAEVCCAAVRVGSAGELAYLYSRLACVAGLDQYAAFRAARAALGLTEPP